MNEKWTREIACGFAVANKLELMGLAPLTGIHSKRSSSATTLPDYRTDRVMELSRRADRNRGILKRRR